MWISSSKGNENYGYRGGNVALKYMAGLPSETFAEHLSARLGVA